MTRIDYRDVDLRFYASRLRDFLPDSIVDVHTHVWRRAFAVPPPEGESRTVAWPTRVAEENPIADLIETYRVLLPGKRVTPMVFATTDVDLEAANAYVQDAARAHRFPALIFSHPAWTAEEFERRVEEGGFLGAKSYLSLAPPHLKANDIRLFDFFPPHQLEVMNRRGWIMMLHLPRSHRLRDPVNLADLLALEERFPRIRGIVAHVGRAYCGEDVGNAFETLRRTRRLCFDISANTNAAVFEGLIRCVGPNRILFGSDMPITRMRMRRICERGVYVNLVPRGLYGEVTGDPHMREVDGAEAERLTLFLYEELEAFRRAAEACGLSRDDIGAVFGGNARRLLDPRA